MGNQGSVTNLVGSAVPVVAAAHPLSEAATRAKVLGLLAGFAGARGKLAKRVHRVLRALAGALSRVPAPILFGLLFSALVLPPRALRAPRSLVLRRVGRQFSTIQAISSLFSGTAAADAQAAPLELDSAPTRGSERVADPIEAEYGLDWSVMPGADKPASAAPSLQTEESARAGRPRVPSANCLLGGPRLISLSLPQLDSKVEQSSSTAASTPKSKFSSDAESPGAPVADPDTPSKLRAAANDGDAEEVDRLIAEGLDVCGSDENGFQALHWATGSPNISRVVVQKLITAGASVHAATDKGFRAIHYAALRGNDQAIAVLLAAKADVEAALPSGARALHLAARQGHASTLACLLAARADTAATYSEKEWTALHEAATEGHCEAISELVNGGAPVDAVDRNGMTAVHLAAEFGQCDAIGILVDVGGDKLKAAHEKKGAVAGPPRRCSSWRKVFADSKAKAHGDTPLHRAAGAGHSDAVAKLLDIGADLTKRTKDGSSALHFAATSGTPQTVEALLDAGADASATDKWGGTALHLASRNMQYGDAVTHLLAAAERRLNIGRGGTSAAVLFRERLAMANEDWRSFVRRRDDEAMGRDDKLRSGSSSRSSSPSFFGKLFK